MEEYKIPLRNIKGEIIDHTIVSPEDYEHLNQYKWYKTLGYVKRHFKNNNKCTTLFMHRYIIIEIEKKWKNFCKLK